MSSTTMPRKLWEHPDVKSTEMWKFKSHAEKKLGRSFPSYFDLYNYSITSRASFWDTLWNYSPIVYSGGYTTVVDESARMDSIPSWFEGVKLNFAENILYSGTPGRSGTRSTKGKEDSKVAVTEVREGASSVRDLTWGELRKRVGGLSQAMRARGVKKGDRVAVVSSNSIDTLLVFLSVTALGGLFSSSSTDMGPKGVLDRLLQIKPRWLFMDDFTVYNGKRIDLRQKMTEIVNGMSSVTEFQGLVSQPRFPGKPADISQIPRAQSWDSFLSAGASDELTFERVEYRDPFLIVYSSGTTGTPKCIVHSVGGVITSSSKEGRLHRDMKPDCVCLQYTTTGWIMYFVQLLNMLTGAKVVLYDGSPFTPDLLMFVKLMGSQKVTHFGTSPRYLQELQRNGVVPQEIADLTPLRNVTSTGMVLSDALFEWFYDGAFPNNVHLGNISGGTDLAGAFGIECPILPVYVGGCQCASLGTPVKVYDSLVEGGKGVKGVEVPDGTPGELVAPVAFPNMPVKFWGENGDQRYFDSYFARFDDAWTHGDFIMIHPLTRGVVFLGRADGVLNPSGVRFGSAEIYSVIETQFTESIADSIAVGQRRPSDTDEQVLLFLLMKPGKKFNAGLVRSIREAIAKELSPRHVPKYVFETPDIPTTVNLKKVELPVKQIVCGRIIKPSGTLANPESLDYYYQFAKVEELVKAQPKL